MEKVVMHEDFELLIELLTRIKQHQQRAQTGYRPVNAKSREAFPPAEIENLVEKVQRIREQQQSRKILRRGEDVSTDVFMNDLIRNLQRELDYIQELDQGTQEKKESIAIKYPKWQTDILMQWMVNHIHNPFPDSDQIQQLMQETGLTHSQIVNWTTNCRKRSKKATLAGGKKAHGFIDHMFIAATRDSTQDQQVAHSYSMEPSMPEVVASDVNNVISPTRSSCASIAPHDECFDDPIPITSTPDENILADFAASWLYENDQSAQTHVQSTNTTPALLPKVSEDSCESPPAKRQRTDSFDLMDESMDASMAEWANEHEIDLSSYFFD